MNRLVSIAVSCFLLLCLTSLGASQTPSAYTRAEALVKDGKFDAGIAILKDILQHDPGNLRAYNLMGIAFSSQGDLNAANQQYKKALQINPGFVPVLKNLAFNEIAERKFSEAQAHLISALKFAPNDPRIHADLGKIDYQKNDFASAAAHLSKAGPLLQQDSSLAAALVESYLQTDFLAKTVRSQTTTSDQQRALDLLSQIDPARLTAQMQFRLGSILAREQFFHEALPFFQSVAAKYPDSYDVAFNLAVSQIETKQFVPAITTLNQIAERGHKTAELDNLLAEAYEGNKQTQEAINALREATQLAPNDEENYVDLAILCTDYDAFDLGLEIIEVGLTHLPNSERLIFQRGVIRAMQSKFDLAEPDFQLAAKLAPESNSIYVAMGISYMQTGDLPKAIEALHNRIRQKPNDYTLQYLLGEALIRSGVTPGEQTFSEAKVALQKSIALNPRFAASRTDLAKLYLQENRVDDALIQLEKAREIDPKEKSAYSQLALAYKRKGNAEHAGEMLKILNQLNDEERTQNKRERVRLVKQESGSNTSQQQ